MDCFGDLDIFRYCYHKLLANPQQSLQVEQLNLGYPLSVTRQNIIDNLDYPPDKSMFLDKRAKP